MSYDDPLRPQPTFDELAGMGYYDGAALAIPVEPKRTPEPQPEKKPETPRSGNRPVPNKPEPPRSVTKATTPSEPPRLTGQLASEVKVERPVWHWRYWLVAAAVQLLIGRQGSGKSTFAAWVIAQLSSGRPWPGESENRAPVPCAMLSLEEPAERLAARLTAAGADLKNVWVLGDVVGVDREGNPFRRRWQLPDDCAALAASIKDRKVEVVTIDGLGYSVQGDSHNYAVVGSALSALASVAEITGATIIGLTHPPKGRSDAVTAAIGSTAWTAVARISWVMDFDPTDTDDKQRRVVRPAPGSNYRLPERGLSFRIAQHDESEAGFVTGLEFSDVSADEIMAPPEPEPSEEMSKLDAAREFVRRVVAVDMANGPVRSDAAKVAAAKGDISERTLRRAMKLEGVKSAQRGTVAAADWQWELVDPPSGQSARKDDVGHMGANQFEQRVYADESGSPYPSGHGQMGEDGTYLGPSEPADRERLYGDDDPPEGEDQGFWDDWQGGDC
jgi:putative DNA primase/helicase